MGVGVKGRCKREGIYVYIFLIHAVVQQKAKRNELKSFLMKVKEESEKNWLKAQHSEN